MGAHFCRVFLRQKWGFLFSLCASVFPVVKALLIRRRRNFDPPNPQITNVIETPLAIRATIPPWISSALFHK